MHDSPLMSGEPRPQQTAAVDPRPASDSAGAAPPDPAALVDFSVLDQWSDELGRDTVRNLIDIYLRNSAELLDLLGAAARDRDMARLAQTAHGLKGSSSNLGIKAMFEPARTLEAAARGGDAGRALELAASLRAIFDQVAIALGGHDR